MIRLQVNGETKQIADTCSVADALDQWGYRRDAIAIAINGQFIPRAHYAQHNLQEQDSIDIVAPIQGG